MTHDTHSLVALRPMRPRDPHEEGRVATPLELLFDLASVIAIAAAAAGLHHAISDNHIVEGVARFAAAFFAIWWAWMNYTWFASAYDNSDAVFRLLTMLVMSGALTMAAGMSGLLGSLDLTLPVSGYIIMRLGMVTLWLRAASHDTERRRTCLRYASGIALVQVYWVILLLVRPSPSFFYPMFLIGAIGELAVPVWAEKHRETPWHLHHITERYGLLNIIVLGETLLSASNAIQKAAAHNYEIALVHAALAALVILFSMWWLYFSREEHLQSTALHRALTWGYGHVLIFASGAAVGAGFGVVVDVATHHAKVGMITALCAVNLPVALYLFGLWFVRDRFVLQGPARHVLLVFSLVALFEPLAQFGLGGTAALLVLAIICRTALACRTVRSVE